MYILIILTDLFVVCIKLYFVIVAVLQSRVWCLQRSPVAVNLLYIAYVVWNK